MTRLAHSPPCSVVHTRSSLSPRFHSGTTKTSRLIVTTLSRWDSTTSVAPDLTRSTDLATNTPRKAFLTTVLARLQSKDNIKHCRRLCDKEREVQPISQKRISSGDTCSPAHSSRLLSMCTSAEEEELTRAPIPLTICMHDKHHWLFVIDEYICTLVPAAVATVD